MSFNDPDQFTRYDEALDAFQNALNRLKTIQPPVPWKKPLTDTDLLWISEVQYLGLLQKQFREGRITPKYPKSWLYGYRRAKTVGRILQDAIPRHPRLNFSLITCAIR